ncbi:MAG: CHASE3 domain-containing protein, partial [Phenylobacterium sp.]
MSLNDLNIAKKLALGFAGVVTIVTVMCVGLALNLHSIKDAVSANDLEVAQLNQAHEVELQLIERMNGVRGFAITGDASFLKAVDTAKDKYQTAMNAWIKAAPEDKATTGAVKAEMDGIFADQDEQVSLAKDPATRPLALEKLGKKGRLNKIRALLKAYGEQEAKLLKHDADAQTQSQEFATATLWGGAAVAVLLSVLMGWLLSRAIASPISAMTGAMDKLAGGDHAVDVPAVGRKDEV